MNGYIPDMCCRNVTHFVEQSHNTNIRYDIAAGKKYRYESYILFEQEVDLDFFLLFVFRIMMKKKRTIWLDHDEFRRS